jgi:hypothetical protein
MDWESDVNSNMSASQFSKFFSELYTAINPLGLGISMAAPANKVTILPAVDGYIDFISIMCYDLPAPWYGSLDATKAAVQKWIDAGINPAKLAIGISVAARDNNGAGWYSYRSVIESYDPPITINSTNNRTYSGVALDLDKAEYANSKDLFGIMYYHAGLDIYNHPKGKIECMRNYLDSIVPEPPIIIPIPDIVFQATVDGKAATVTLRTMINE